jgi:hypothetical protein
MSSWHLSLSDQCHRKSSSLASILLEMPVTLNLFVSISCETDCQASRIYQHIFVSVAIWRQPVAIVLCVLCTYLLYEHRLCALNGQMIMMSSGCNIPVVPPGMFIRLHFSCHIWAFTFFCSLAPEPAWNQHGSLA